MRDTVRRIDCLVSRKGNKEIKSSVLDFITLEMSLRHEISKQSVSVWANKSGMF